MKNAKILFLFVTIIFFSNAILFADACPGRSRNASNGGNVVYIHNNTPNKNSSGQNITLIINYSLCGYDNGTNSWRYISVPAGTFHQEQPGGPCAETKDCWNNTHTTATMSGSDVDSGKNWYRAINLHIDGAQDEGKTYYYAPNYERDATSGNPSTTEISVYCTFNEQGDGWSFYIKQNEVPIDCSQLSNSNAINGYTTSCPTYVAPTPTPGGGSTPTPTPTPTPQPTIF